MIMKYNNSSLFSISYGVSSSSAAAAAAATKKNPNAGFNTYQPSSSPSSNQSPSNTSYDSDVYYDPVFKENGEAIDEDGYIYQYFKNEKKWIYYWY